MLGAVGSLFVVLATALIGAIESHHIVIADASESASAVPAVDVGGREVFPLRGGGAVDDDFFRNIHGCRNLITLRN